MEFAFAEEQNTGDNLLHIEPRQNESHIVTIDVIVEKMSFVLFAPAVGAAHQLRSRRATPLQLHCSSIAMELQAFGDSPAWSRPSTAAVPS